MGIWKKPVALHALYIGQVVSPVQLYLDLRVSTDRGNEAAEFIFREFIEPQWKKIK
jgi:hypothetical protein